MYITKYCDPKTHIIDRLREMATSPTTLFVVKKLIKLDENIDKEFIERLAEQTDGFSAREIEKFVVACHDWAFSQEDPVLDRARIGLVLNNFLVQHRARQDWTSSPN